MYMGRKDIVTKEYIRRPEIFADIFNYRLYDGKDRIQPEQLAEENITENLVLEREEHGKQKRIKLEAVEKYRDVKKVFRDGSYRCLILGVEEQDSVHYAMPVREFVYDAMAYEHQIREISRTHRKEKDYKEHGKEEFLSGFYREDYTVGRTEKSKRDDEMDWGRSRKIHTGLPVKSDYPGRNGR